MRFTRNEKGDHEKKGSPTVRNDFNRGKGGGGSPWRVEGGVFIVGRIWRRGEMAWDYRYEIIPLFSYKCGTGGLIE